jgi:hypothetical protein
MIWIVGIAIALLLGPLWPRGVDVRAADFVREYARRRRLAPTRPGYVAGIIDDHEVAIGTPSVRRVSVRVTLPVALRAGIDRDPPDDPALAEALVADGDVFASRCAALAKRGHVVITDSTVDVERDAICRDDLEEAVSCALALAKALVAARHRIESPGEGLVAARWSELAAAESGISFEPNTRKLVAGAPGASITVTFATPSSIAIVIELAPPLGLGLDLVLERPTDAGGRPTLDDLQLELLRRERAPAIRGAISLLVGHVVSVLADDEGIDVTVDVHPADTRAISALLRDVRALVAALRGVETGPFR